MKKIFGMRALVGVAVGALIVSAIATTPEAGVGKSNPVSNSASKNVSGSGKACVLWCVGPTSCDYIALGNRYIKTQYNPMTTCVTVTGEMVCTIDSTLPCKKFWSCDSKVNGECTDCTRTAGLDEMADHCTGSH